MYVYTPAQGDPFQFSRKICFQILGTELLYSTILASAVLSQYTRVLDDRSQSIENTFRRHIPTIAELLAKMKPVLRFTLL